MAKNFRLMSLKRTFKKIENITLRTLADDGLELIQLRFCIDNAPSGAHND